MTSFVTVTRGELIESRHDFSVAVAEAGGALVAASGDPNRIAYWRSCAKPFQGVPALVEGVVETLGIGDEELSLACASHNGEPRHVTVARRLLARSGAGEDDLVCGPHASINEDIARAMASRNEKPTRAHNNCSGKHALMIALARHQRWGSDGYHRPDHPLQQRCLAEVAAWSGLVAEAIPWATDGCGVPSFAMSLRSMALAWARLGVAAVGGAVPAVSVASREAMARLMAAVRAHPFLVAGTGRLDTELIGGTAGRILPKVGAEGVYCAAVPELGLGVALKVHDGAARALGPALLGVLEAVAPGLAPHLDLHRSPDIRNTLGDTVGHVQAHVELRRDARKR